MAGRRPERFGRKTRMGIQARNGAALAETGVSSRLSPSPAPNGARQCGRPHDLIEFAHPRLGNSDAIYASCTRNKRKKCRNHGRAWRKRGSGDAIPAIFRRFARPHCFFNRTSYLRKRRFSSCRERSDMDIFCMIPRELRLRFSAEIQAYCFRFTNCTSWRFGDVSSAAIVAGCSGSPAFSGGRS